VRHQSAITTALWCLLNCMAFRVVVVVGWWADDGGGCCEDRLLCCRERTTLDGARV
jgi:hypothetical protein